MKHKFLLSYIKDGQKKTLGDLGDTRISKLKSVNFIIEKI